MGIVGIGIDNAEVKRFADWCLKQSDSLRRIFSMQEIEYCLTNKTKSAERFAVRFAAREALFKALQPLLCKSLPFLLLCRHVTIVKNQINVPEVLVEWQAIKSYLNLELSFIDYTTLNIHVSITHTTCCACALVIIEE